MDRYSRTHVPNDVLVHNLKSRVAHQNSELSDVLADIGEYDDRRLYAPAGYDSTFRFCVCELHLSEQSAFKRIWVARLARRFPAIFEMIADGRLHLSGLVVLRRYFTRRNAAELLAAATHKSVSEIRLFKARRFPQKDLPTKIAPVANPSSAAIPVGPEPFQNELSPEKVEASPIEVSAHAEQPVAPTQPETKFAAPTERDYPTLTPLAPERFALQMTISQEIHDKLVHFRSLVRHQIPSGDLVALLDKALDIAVSHAEKQKFGATDQPKSRDESESSSNPRYIPYEVRREVWKRDGGRCAFVSEDGHRCGSEDFLEFDHFPPVSKGGRSIVAEVRLLCRAHNQYVADCELGTELMNAKRDVARRAKAARAGVAKAPTYAPIRPAPQPESEAEKREAARARALQAMPFLRSFGASG